MKILLISTLDSGGAATSCIRLHKGLLKLGIESRLLVLDQKNPEIEASQAFYGSRKIFSQLKDAQQKFLGSRKYKLRNLPKTADLFTFPYSSHQLHRHPLIEWADVINLHWVSRFLDFPSFFRHCNKPVIWTLHDMNAFSGGYHYEKGFPMQAYQPVIRENLAVKKRSLKDRELHIVCPSRWLCEVSGSSEVFQRFPHTVIPYGIDTGIFKPHRMDFSREIFGLDPAKKVILFVAHNIQDERKGLSLLIDALPALPTDEIELAVLGAGSSALKIHHQVKYLGKIQDERLMALAYAAADLYVIPSREDNLPNTVIESICCGTPVAGFQIGGVPDMIQPGLNGFMAASISAESLGVCMKKALAHPFDRQQIREDAVQRYDETIQAGKYLELCRQMGLASGQ